MSCILYALGGLAIGLAAAVAVFVYHSRKHPDRVAKAQDAANDPRKLF